MEMSPVEKILVHAILIVTPLTGSKRCNPTVAHIHSSPSPEHLRLIPDCKCGPGDQPQEWEWVFVVGEKLDQDESGEDDELARVDQIKDSRRRKGKVKEYMVHYENTDLNECVWESLEVLRVVNYDKVREFELQKKGKNTN